MAAQVVKSLIVLGDINPFHVTTTMFKADLYLSRPQCESNRVIESNRGDLGLDA